MRPSSPHLMSVAAGAVLVGSFLPWVRVGSRDRSSYVLTGVLTRLEFAPGGPAEWTLRFWPIMPVLLVGTVVAVWAGLRVVGGSLGLLAACYAGGLGLIVWSAPVDVRAGVLMAVAAAPFLALASILHLARPADHP